MSQKQHKLPNPPNTHKVISNPKSVDSAVAYLHQKLRVNIHVQNIVGNTDMYKRITNVSII